MAKIGRPKSDIVKDCIITLRLSHEEREKLKDYAKKHQQTITQAIKAGVDLLYKTNNQKTEETKWHSPKNP